MEETEMLRKRIESLEFRVSELENKQISSGPLHNTPVEPKTLETKTYSGLKGGLNFLIDSDFLASPKTVEEILNELKKEGYHYPHSSVSKILSVDLLVKKRTLTRININGVWGYAVRK